MNNNTPSGAATAAKITLILVTTLVTLLACEGAFRVYLSVVNLHDMEMHKYATHLKHRSSVPGLNHEHRPNSSAKLMGVEVRTNSLGFRSTWEPADPPKDETRIFVVGNSITLGWGVEFPDIFTEKAQSALNDSHAFPNPCRIINAGIGNMDTFQEEKMLQSHIQDVKPRLVVLHFYLDDVEPIEPGNSNWLLKNSYLTAFTYIRVRQAMAMGGAANGGIGNFYARFYSDSNPAWTSVYKAIREMKDTCSSQGANFAVLIQPDLHNLSPGAGQWAALQFVETRLHDAGINSLQVGPRFMEKYQSDPKAAWVASDDPHPNSAGHLLMAAALSDLIKSSIGGK